ncbi:hypothetical protein [Agrococcus jejuensis]|uniref:Uncharacterized protein n=1 Tax=Agrococcus jejuensis TaxID=399736 RepID=A0A1G8D3U8_9MICO|nr:hypothetical protein [Agrococcus jejuensis]SDH52223.1 hypothetical protein SAMN04489720_1503 [Agrococcus jejuensis]
MIRWTMAAWLLVGGVGMLVYAFMMTNVLPIAPGADVGWDVLFFIWLGWFVLYLAISVAAIVDAVRTARRRDVARLATGMVAVKLSSILFFVLNFLSAATFSAILLFFGPAALVSAAVLSTVTYVIMVPTSAYGVAALIRMRRDRVIGAGFFWTLLPLHFVFVVDIVASLVVAHRIRRLRRTPMPAPDPREWAAFAQLQQRQP